MIVGVIFGDIGGVVFEVFKICDGIDIFFMFFDGKVFDF